MTLSFNARSDGATLLVLICMTICLSPLAIVSIYYANAESDAECQEGTRAGLTLSEWLMGSGIEKLAVIASIWFAVILKRFFLLNASIGDASFGIGVVVIVADVFFTIIWWIIGVVILATNENNKCVAEGNPMAIVAIVTLVLTWFSNVLFDSLLSCPEK